MKDATFARVDQLLPEHIFHYKHFCEVILAYRVVYFKENMFWGFSLTYFIFIFSLLWALKRMRSFTNVDAFSKVRNTSSGFPKRCDRILSDKDVFKTSERIIDHDDSV